MATMTTDDQNRLIGQILADDGFREALMKDPQQALRDNNYPVDYQVIDAIKATPPEVLNQALAAFTKGRGHGPCR